MSTALNRLTIDTIDADFLRKHYCFGVDLYDQLGNEMSPETIQVHINNAISQCEEILRGGLRKQIIKSKPIDDGLTLGQDYHQVIERLSYHSKQTRNFLEIKLPHNNIISVERLSAFIYGNEQSTFTFNADDVRISHPKEGILHVVPTTSFLGIFANVFTIPQANRSLPLINTKNFPNFWQVDYTIAPEIGVRSDGGLGTDLESDTYYIPDVVAEWICKTAAITVLNIAQTARLPGTASETISFDGFSRSRSTTASAIYGLYSSIIKGYQDDLKRIDLAKLRRRQRGIMIL